MYWLVQSIKEGNCQKLAALTKQYGADKRTRDSEKSIRDCRLP